MAVVQPYTHTFTYLRVGTLFWQAKEVGIVSVLSVHAHHRHRLRAFVVKVPSAFHLLQATGRQFHHLDVRCWANCSDYP
jgi:hypothetical protein